MGSKERKERERREKQELILKTAAKIMKEDGIDNISIRKIASRIEYSPAIIYHYFKDKDEILNHLMQRGYRKILDGLAAALDTTDDPREKLRQMTRNYIEVSLQMSDEYKAVQLNSTPGVVAQTASLFKDAAAKKPALKILFQGLKEIYKDRDIDDNDIELTAQIIAASTFGLIIRLIMEQDLVTEEHRINLIEHFIKVTVDGIVLGNIPERS
ncbi:TetR/AcrR family transcriptional regulator [Phosphitispora fastidiosa]|uniref:TetR/AcrR family transcriptional regulator n=1 Tax=Phosphitispora fastidiosa TaxID=2837202 RepID=UPI001E2E34DA|nr:TetR/AcrR family transcriptional regulator [Phosphitispora fastidiosa]MBU7006915.1 AcrR family transcriptional regulator [Phosphitispora fastidiosa]